MRVAFDEQIFAIQPYGGISRMFAELAKAFIENPDLDVQLLGLNAPVINRYVLDDPELKKYLAVKDAKHEYVSLSRYLMRVQPRRHLDIVHNTFYLPHGLAAYPKAKRIVTVHDMIPERMPETRRRLDFLTLKKRYVSSADHVICVSEATKQDMLDVYGPLDKPITVIHHGVDPIFTPGAPKLPAFPENYLLFVGNRGAYKDASVLIEAFAAISNDPNGEHHDLALVFVGGGAFTSDERTVFNNLGISEKVAQFSLPDHAMPAAYGNARALVFPSRFEGFGLPALEAMACGTQTILANATSLPEVGGDVATYFPPKDSQELAQKILHTLKSTNETTINRGIER